MKTTIAILLLPLGVLMAQDSKQPAKPGGSSTGGEPAAATSTASAPAAEPYDLKNKSSFTMEDNIRAPFWPIGANRKGTQQAAPQVQEEPKIIPVLRPEHFTVTSVLLGRPSLATINGRSFSQGEVLPVIFDGRKLPVILRFVRDGGVQLDYENRSLFVPLKRVETPGRVAAPEQISSAQPILIIDPAKEPK